MEMNLNAMKRGFPFRTEETGKTKGERTDISMDKKSREDTFRKKELERTDIRPKIAVGDIELTQTASKLIQGEKYREIREKYTMHNSKAFVSADTHRLIMQEAIDLAKVVVGSGGTEEEMLNACLYFYVCMDARKYRLNHQKARKDLGIQEMKEKYLAG